MARIPTVTVDQMRRIERLTVEQYGVAPLQLIENAGRSLAELVRRRLDDSLENRVIVVLAGKDKTGAGGLSAARHLHNWGAVVQVVLASPPSEMDEAARHQLTALERVGVEIWGYSGNREDGPVIHWSDASLLLDALLGGDLKEDPRGPYAELIRVANVSRRPIVSLDVPSGLDASDGTIYSPTIDATATLALGLPMVGLIEGAPVVGDLYVADVGIPPDVYAAMGLAVGPLFSRETVVYLGGYRAR